MVARGIAQRAGLVMVPSSETLWLQEVVREKGLQIKSIRQTRLTWNESFTCGQIERVVCYCDTWWNESVEDENDDGYFT